MNVSAWAQNERVYGQKLLQQRLPKFFNNGPHYHKSKYASRMFFYNNGKVKLLSYSKNKSPLVVIIQMSSHWQLLAVTPCTGRQVVKTCWLTGSSVLANYVKILPLKILGRSQPRIRRAIFGLRAGHCTPALWRGNDPGFEWHVLNELTCKLGTWQSLHWTLPSPVVVAGVFDEDHNRVFYVKITDCFGT